MDSDNPLIILDHCTPPTTIWVLPFFGQGHLLPCMELCKHLAFRNFKVTFIIPSNLTSSIPPSFLHHPLLQVSEIPSSDHPFPPPPPPPPPQELQHSGPDQMGHPHGHNTQMEKGLEDLILAHSRNSGSGIPNFVVIDIMMSRSREVFAKYGVPAVGFFTSGACSAAMEYAIWKAKARENLEPGVTRVLRGLPQEMAVTDSDLKTKPHGPPGGGPPHGPRGRGPPPGPPPFGRLGSSGPAKNGFQPPWLEETEGYAGLMINTCRELEGPFVEYLANKIGKPVWVVGPLLPGKYWNSTGSVLRDSEFRSNRRSNVSEEEVLSWLDCKPIGSVLYVSFGSEVSPENEELSQLAGALEASNRPFIWVVQSSHRRPRVQPGSGDSEEGFYPHGLDQRVGDRGLIIRGWASQLLILSHPSTGGFLSHCGWNSTTEAIGLGVPILAWPIRGDQHFNAKLVVKYVRVGCMISNDMSKMVEKDDIMRGIESLLGNQDVKRRAEEVRAKFEHRYPRSSVASLDAFGEFIIVHNAAD